MILGVVGNFLENQSHIANAGSHVSDLPRRFRLGFIEKACRQIPSDCGRVLRTALRLARFIQKLVWRKGGFADQLRGVT